jgi:septal ring factor EnvC (AmiA/AmiB activator)
MSAVLEQYFQSVVVDKIREMISNQFQEIKDDIEAQFNEMRSDIKGLKKLESNYADIRIDIESLKNRISELGQDISGKMHNDIAGCENRLIGTIRKDLKDLLSKNGEKPVVAKPATAKKVTVKKATTRKKKAKK